MAVSTSLLVWIWYLGEEVKSISLAYIPVWLWSVIATISSGVILSVLFSSKKIKGITKIIFAIVILAIFVSATLMMHRITETQQQKMIDYLKILIERKTILLDTRVKVGENPHFISGDFVDVRPLIKVLSYRKPTGIGIQLIDEVTLENVDKGITIDIKNFDCERLSALPKKSLDPGHYVANLTVTTLFLNATENGEFKREERESTKYQTEFIVAEQFGIKDFSVYQISIEDSPPSTTTVRYVLTKSASSVEMFVYDVQGKLISTVNNLPTYAGYNNYSCGPWDHLTPALPHLSLLHKCELRAKKDGKVISKTDERPVTFLLSMSPSY